MTGESTAREETEVQALWESHGTVVTVPAETPLPYFFSWAILNLTHPLQTATQHQCCDKEEKRGGANFNQLDMGSKSLLFT